MKVCPKCNAQYEYEMTFCLRDGERLVLSGSTSEVTQAFEGKTPKTAEMNFIYTNKQPQINEKFKVTSSNDVPKFENNIDQPKLRSNFVIGLLAGVLATFALVFAGVNYLAPSDKNDAAANSNNSLSNQNSNSSNPSESTEIDSEMMQFNESFYTGLRDRLRTSAKNNGLKSLADSVLPKDSIEVRFYLFPGFFAPTYKGFALEESVLFLRKDSSIWSGKIIRNVVKSNSENPNAKEKITESLGQPASGWDNLWQKLQTAGISAPPTKSETKVKEGSSLYIIEGKENGKYTYSYFHVPKENSGIEEERRIATIFNLIAKEFNVSDLKAN